jgi:alkylation response protein AidB-like acyl-CoA dehydrogenase
MTSYMCTEEERAIQETFHRFTEEQVKPRAQAIDEAKEFPRELFEQVGALGLFGMRYPEKWGGTEASTRAYLLAIEELARGSLSLAACCTMQSLMGTYFIFRSGNDDICGRFLVPAIKGEKVGTICITEPDAGSDLDAIATRATEHGNGWVLNGAKTWITSAPAADFFTVFAVTKEGDKPRDRELSVLLVERDTDGLTVGKTIEKMGLWGSVTSEVNFDDCRIPATNLLGERGKGQAYLREILARIRLTTAALALGVGEVALEDAVQYAGERVQFGKPIGKYQAIKVQLADRATELEAARHLIAHAAWREDEGLANMKEASMAKLFASESALSACDTAARVLASYGYAMEYPVQRYLRDVRFTLIGGGTSEILKLIIAKEIGL